jgi:hypothetical protein
MPHSSGSTSPGERLAAPRLRDLPTASPSVPGQSVNDHPPGTAARLPPNAAVAAGSP